MRGLACVLLVGCLPATTSSTLLLDRQTSGVISDPTGPVRLDTEVTEGVIVVRATQPRRCHRDVSDVVQVTTTQVARQLGTEDGQKWGWLLLPLWIIAWPVEASTAVYTYATTSGSKPEVTQHVEKVTTLDVPCGALPIAGVRFHVAFPSGATIDGVTDDLGVFTYLATTRDLSVPGPLVTRIELAPDTRSSAPGADLPAPVVAVPLSTPAVPLPPLAPSTLNGFPAVRQALVRCAPRYGVTGVVKLKLAIDTGGAVTSVTPDRADSSFASCLKSTLVNARFDHPRNLLISVSFMVPEH